MDINFVHENRFAVAMKCMMLCSNCVSKCVLFITMYILYGFILFETAPGCDSTTTRTTTTTIVITIIIQLQQEVAMQ